MRSSGTFDMDVTAISRGKSIKCAIETISCGVLKSISSFGRIDKISFKSYFNTK